MHLPLHLLVLPFPAEEEVFDKNNFFFSVANGVRFGRFQDKDFLSVDPPCATIC